MIPALMRLAMLVLFGCQAAQLPAPSSQTSPKPAAKSRTWPYLNAVADSRMTFLIRLDLTPATVRSFYAAAAEKIPCGPQLLKAKAVAAMVAEPDANFPFRALLVGGDTKAITRCIREQLPVTTRENQVGGYNFVRGDERVAQSAKHAAGLIFSRGIGITADGAMTEPFARKLATLPGKPVALLMWRRAKKHGIRFAYLVAYLRADNENVDLELLGQVTGYTAGDASKWLDGFEAGLKGLGNDSLNINVHCTRNDKPMRSSIRCTLAH